MGAIEKFHGAHPPRVSTASASIAFVGRAFATSATRCRNDSTERCCNERAHRKGRTIPRRRRAGNSTHVRIARSVTARQIAFHFAFRRHVDLQALCDDGADARLHVRRIHELVYAVLVLAHEGTVGTALRLAASFEFGKATNVARQVLVRRARAVAARGACFRAGAGGLCRAGFTTSHGAARFRVRDTIAVGVLRFAFGDKGLFAFFFTAADAIDRRRIAARRARISARIGAAGNWFALAFAVATSLKVQ